MKIDNIIKKSSFIQFTEKDAEKTLSQRFESCAENYPEQLAIKTKDNSITYYNLNMAANRLAHLLIDRDGKSDLPIPLLLSPGINTVIGIFGVLKAGRIWTVLNPDMPRSKLAYIINEVKGDTIIIDKENIELARDLSGKSSSLLMLGETDKIHSIKNPQISVQPDSVSHIIYTSGTTGNPKGIIQTNRNQMHYIREQTNSLYFCREDKFTLLLSQAFSAGIMDTFRALLNGATLYHFDTKNESIAELSEWLKKEKITIFHLFPLLFRQLTDSFHQNSSFPDIRLIHLAGESVTNRDVEAYKKWFPDNCILCNNLGATESNTYRRYIINKNTTIKDKSVPVGYPIEYKEILLLDENGNQVNDGIPGEIAVRSKYLSPGYLNDSKLTAKKFLPDSEDTKKRIFLTGDMGKMLPDGCLTYTGRKDFMVKIRGYRVETEAVTIALLSLDSVKEAIVVDIEHQALGEKRLVAYIIPAAKPIEVGELREALAKIVPDYMIPAYFVFIESLPMLGNGKIDRKALPPPDMTRPELGKNFVAPRSPIEKKLADIWAGVLKINKIGIYDSFFELGGNSLLGVRLIAEIEKAIGKPISLKALFRFTTVEQMAKAIKADETSLSIPITDTGKSGSPKLSKQDYSKMLAVIGSCKVPPVKLGSLMLKKNSDSSGLPLFWCFNSLEAEMSMLAQHLGPRQRLYGLFSGSKILDPKQSYIKSIAYHYIDEILSIEPEEPYLIGGNCRGGAMACEIALCLQDMGKRVDRLCLLETFDERLFEYPGKMLLLYGKKSHLKAYKPFHWQEPGWKERFRSIPEVGWVPGAHGEFFREKNIKVLAEKISGFINNDPGQFKVGIKKYLNPGRILKRFWN